MIKNVFVLIFLLQVFLAQSQPSRHIDSLFDSYKNKTPDSTFINEAVKLIQSYISGSYDTLGMRISDLKTIAEKINHTKGIFEVNTLYTYYYYMRGNYKKALQFAHINREIGRIQKNYIWEGTSLLNMAESSLKSMDLVYARKHLDEAFGIFAENKDSVHLAKCNLKVSFIKQVERQYDSCYYYAKLASDILLREGIYDKYISSLKMMGEASIKMQRIEEAIRLNQECFDVVKKYNVPFDMAELYLDRALILNTAGRHQQAVEFGELALDIANRDSIIREIALAAEYLSVSHYALGNFEEAHDYLALRFRVEMRIFNMKPAESINELNTKYSSEQRERENDYLKEKAGILQSQITARNWFIIITLMGSSALFISLIFVFRSRVKLRESMGLLAMQNKTIEQINVKLQEQLVIAEQQQEEISVKNNELNHHIDMQNKLIYVIAHDLVSPFSAMLGLTEITMNRFATLSEEDKVSNLKYIYQAASRNYMLTKNMLTWIRSYSNNLKIEQGKVNISETIESVFKSLAEVFHNKQLVVLNKTDNALSIWADANMFETVMRNLIQNATKFTPVGGRITVKSWLKNKNVQIVVKDTGQGIEQGDIPKLFSIDSNQIAAEGKGTGFGLLICKEFVERNNGKIWAESEWGDGTSFVVELPLAN